MRLRTAVLTTAGFGIPLALLVAFLPITWGYGGYNATDGRRLYFVDPTGPAARAGLRTGEQTLPLAGMDNIEQYGGLAGTTIHLQVVRPAGIVPVAVRFEPFPGALGVQQRFNKLLGALTALGAFIVAMLVLFRARNVHVGARAAAVLAAAGLQALAVSGALVAVNALAATVCYYILPILLSGATFWTALLLLAAYPPNPTRIRTLAGAAAPWLLGAYVVSAASRAYGIWYGHNAGFTALDSWLHVVSSTVLAVAILDAIATAPAEYRTATRWLGGSWLIADIFAALGPIAAILHIYPVVRSHYGDVLGAFQVFFLAFGVAYTVLRHRLVDLNVFVTRATIFGIVSVILVAIFVAAEWAISKIFEQSIGLTRSNGLGSEIPTLAIVLILGISARTIHRFVEARTTQVFFRRRLKALAEIRRVAREADASTDARAVIDLACATVLRYLAPLGVACYIREGGAYKLASYCGDAHAPIAYQFNEAVPLRLRRWQEPFEVDDDSDERFHMLFLPMMLRGELLGFLNCGPKVDRTPYLPDEVEALSLLTHQIGIATAWHGRSLSTTLPVLSLHGRDPLTTPAL